MHKASRQRDVPAETYRYADMAVAPRLHLYPTRHFSVYISFYCAYVDYFFVFSKMEQFETCAEMYAREFIEMTCLRRIQL